MTDTLHSVLVIAVIAIVTAGIRFAPFAVFRNKAPRAVMYLGNVLPYAIMGMLLVYCFKNVSIYQSPHGLPELAAVLFTALLHKWKHNMLLSILCGTAMYMLILRFVF